MVLSVSAHRFHSEQSTFPSLPCWDFPQELEWLCVVRIGVRSLKDRENTKVCCEKSLWAKALSCPNRCLVAPRASFFRASAFLKDVSCVDAHHSEYLHRTGPPTASRFGSAHFSTHLVLYTPALGSSTLTALILPSTWTLSKAKRSITFRIEKRSREMSEK